MPFLRPHRLPRQRGAAGSQYAHGQGGRRDVVARRQGYAVDVLVAEAHAADLGLRAQPVDADEEAERRLRVGIEEGVAVEHGVPARVQTGGEGAELCLCVFRPGARVSIFDLLEGRGANAILSVPIFLSSPKPMSLKSKQTMQAWAKTASAS